MARGKRARRTEGQDQAPKSGPSSGSPKQTRPRWRTSFRLTIVSIVGGAALAVMLFGGPDPRFVPILLALAALFAIPDLVTNRRRRRVTQVTVLSLCIVAVFTYRLWGPYLSHSQLGPLQPKYSSIQVLRLSSEPGAHNVLRLDNVAAMEYYGRDLDSIELSLPASPPLAVDKRIPGQRYKSGKEWSVRLGTPGSSDMEFKDFRTWESDPSKSFVFDRLKSPTRIVQVGSRRFRVTLMLIRAGSAGLTANEYTFSISEE